MRLLYESIKEDGYTMPVVCYYHAKAENPSASNTSTETTTQTTTKAS